MRDARRRRRAPGSSGLDPSWVLPSEEPEQTSTIAPSHLEVPADGARPAQDRNPEPKPATEAEQPVTTSLQTEPVRRDAPPTNPQQSPKRLVGNQTSLLVLAQKKEGKRLRYTRQQSSDWTDEDMGAGSESDKALGSSHGHSGSELPPPARSTASSWNSVHSYHRPWFTFRGQRVPTMSPGHDAPAISPSVSSTYSPGNGTLHE
jgi:hypothetical protein